jgi:RNA polymerase sigma factor for flagellar operon FliA
VSIELQATWDEYLATKSLITRNELLVHYARTLVRPIALRMARGIPQVSDAGRDFMSFGTFGLIDALDRFDPGRGVRFETFAGPRVRGAILDELRALDWVPRGMRSIGRELDRVEEALINELGRVPTPREIENVVGPKMARQAIVKLQLENDPPEGWGTVDFGQDLESCAVVEDVVDRVSQAVGGLDGRLKAIAALVYVEGRTLTRVGQALGVSESRVCQLQGQFLRELGRALAGNA